MGGVPDEDDPARPPGDVRLLLDRTAVDRLVRLDGREVVAHGIGEVGEPLGGTAPPPCQGLGGPGAGDVAETVGEPVPGRTQPEEPAVAQHRLFENEGTTCARFVLDRRLALAHRRLRDPRFAGHTISSIAYDAGVGDLSYLNRAFRRRYELTPSDARLGAHGHGDRPEDRP